MEVEQAPQWKWKNEIKRVIIEHDNKIEYEALKKIVLKNYVEFTGDKDTESVSEIFDAKVKKLSKVKLVTYVEL